MTRMKPTLLLAALLLLVVTGCRRQAQETPQTATLAPGATISATESMPSPTAVTAPERTSTATPSETDVPDPTLFDVEWTEAGPYQAGLLDAAGATPEGLGDGASVYHMELELGDDLTQLAGLQEVRYTNREDVPLGEIYLRLFPNLADGTTTIHNLSVNGQPLEPSFELRQSAMRVPLEPALQPGDSVVLRIEFLVDVPTEGGGNYNTFVFTEDVLALAHFYPMIAVYDDEGWNLEIAPESGDVVYADSSYYLVRLSAPSGVELAASGVEIEGGGSGQRQSVTYAAGPARDFYLAASEGFEVMSRQVGDVVVNSYSFPDFADASEDVLTYTAEALQSFEQRVGPYPYTELDVVSTPTLALGVEYPGIIVINMELYDPEETQFRRSFLEGTVAHEVAHQWFYNVVGNDQLDDPWLDESLVQYLTMLYYGDVHGPAGAAGFRQSLTQRWAAVDGEEIPVGLPVAAYDGPQYSAIVYGRGPLFFETLSAEMGEETFTAFLRDYYQTYQWDIATPEGLQGLAEQHCACELDALFAEWIYEE